LLTDGRQLLVLARSRLANPNQETANAKSLQTKLIFSSASLPELLAQATTENHVFKRFNANYRELCQQLEDFALATASVSDAVWNVDSSLFSGNGLPRESFDRLFEQLGQCCLALSQQFACAATDQPQSSDGESVWDRLGSSLPAMEESTTPEVLLLAKRCRLFHRSSSEVLRAIDNLKAPPGLTGPRPVNPSGIAWGTRLRMSLLAVVQIFVGVYFLLMTNWPLALHIAAVPIVVLVFKNAVLPVNLATGLLIKSLLTILPVALILHFLIMPYFDDFWELTPLLAIVFFYIVYGMTSPNPFKSVTSVMQVIVINILIFVSDTPPSYEFAQFSNIYLGLTGGFVIVCTIASVFETRNPRIGFEKLVTAICSELSTLVKDSGNQSVSEAENSARRIQHALVNHYQKLNQTFGIIKYQAKPGIQPQQVQAVIDAAGTLVMRGIWIGLDDRYQRSESPEMDDLRDSYSNSLAATGRSLTESRPVTVVSVDDERLRQLPADDYRLEYNSLGDALIDFQRTLNAVDWQKWTQTYF
jgi:uncharacterized membrane protein YccC